MAEKREQALKICKLLRLVLIILMVLTLLTWLLPYFTYPWANYIKKGVKDTTSLFGYLLMPTNFLQMEKLMDVKYLNLANINVLIIMFFSAVFGVLMCWKKKSIWVNLFPLIFSIYGLIGYLRSPFMLLGNHPLPRILAMIFLVLIIIVCIVNIVFHIIEIKNRDEDYYLPASEF